MGVYLFRHADLCLEASRIRRQRCEQDSEILQIVICKVFRLFHKRVDCSIWTVRAVASEAT